MRSSALLMVTDEEGRRMVKNMEHVQGMGSAIPIGLTGCGHLPKQKHIKRMVQMATRAGPEGRRWSRVLLCLWHTQGYAPLRAAVDWGSWAGTALPPRCDAPSRRGPALIGC